MRCRYASWSFGTGAGASGWSAEAGFHFVLSPGPSPLSLLVPADLSPPAQGGIFEISPAVVAVGTEIARRVVSDGGAALLIDYGRSGRALGESLQAVRAHQTAPALNAPGEADLSAHVDFAALARVAAEAGAAVAGPATQGAFLNALGIGLRAERLKRGQAGDAATAIDQAVERLTGPAAMGDLFKVMAIVPAGLAPAGFDAAGTDRP